jgi:triosephosphate isomerase
VFILVNLKAYDVDPITVAEAAVAVAEEYDAQIAVAPQTAHLERVAATGVETWAQHVSPVDHGSHTGTTLAEAAADAGATATLVNHSENRLKLADIDGSLRAAERAGLSSAVCANNPQQSAAAAALGPDAVAVEPPALIGGDVSVATADPAVVEDSVAAVKTVDADIATYCGAGVSDGSDVDAAAGLGAEGVLLASAVAKAEDHRAALENLVA